MSDTTDPFCDPFCVMFMASRSREYVEPATWMKDFMKGLVS